MVEKTGRVPWVGYTASSKMTFLMVLSNSMSNPHSSFAVFLYESNCKSIIFLNDFDVKEGYITWMLPNLAICSFLNLLWSAFLTSTMPIFLVTLWNCSGDMSGFTLNATLYASSRFAITKIIDSLNFKSYPFWDSS